MKKLLVSVSILAVALSSVSCGSRQKAGEGELSGEITVSGAFALYPLAVKWAEEFRLLHPAVRIDISAGGAGKGMTDVLANVADIGMVSRDVYPAELTKGAVPFAVAKDAVVPVISTGNPILADLLKSGLTREDAIALWMTEKYKTWGEVAGTNDRSPIHLYTRSDACGAAETWAQWIGGKQEDLCGTAVYGDPGLAQAVQRDKLGIGFNNLSYAYDENTRQPNPGILILPLDVNGNGQIDPEESFYDTKDHIIAAIAADRYPSPPARDLYMVTNGIPKNEAVAEFLKFILTDGQQYNIPTGYIALAQDKLGRGLALLGVEEPEEKEENAE